MPGDFIAAFEQNLIGFADKITLSKIVEKRDSLSSLQAPRVHEGFSTAQKYFQRVAEIDLGLIWKVYEKYQWDFLLFGYDIEGYF